MNAIKLMFTDFSLWSKYRTELMGITMCGIIIEHMMGRLNAHNVILDFIHTVLQLRLFFYYQALDCFIP